MRSSGRWATMRVLARGTEQRLLDLEQVQLDAAVAELSTDQSVIVLMIEFLLRNEPGGPVMDKAQRAHWLRRAMPPAGLPRRLRPLLEQAQAMAQRFMAAVDAGQPVPDDLGDFCVWLHNQHGPAPEGVE
jgi:hypothetical protein